MTLPDDFASYTQGLMGSELWNRYMAATDEQPTTSIRRNPLKWPAQTAIAVDGAGQVPWCAEGCYLARRPNFTFDPLLHAGAYYVQEASSMFLAEVIRQHVAGPVLMLDLCAAPGGKSTLARAALPEGSLLVSNEPMRQRSEVLAENMQKWGHPDVVVTNNYPADYRSAGLVFDVILADVPCSGEGMFRKEPEALAQWSPALVRQCRDLQRQIVADAWECLRPGGLLIYSTCTLNSLENEENIRHFEQDLGAEVLPVRVEDDWHITGSLLSGWDRPVCRFIPGTTRGEGLFMAVMRKPDGAPAGLKPAKRKRNGSSAFSRPRNGVPNLAGMPIESDNHFVAEMGTQLIAVSNRWEEVCRQIAATLRVLLMGVTIAEQKGRDWVPAESLALSSILNKSLYHCVELSHQQAISYLRRESFALPGDTPRGFVLVCYQGQPLGFMKNIGNRANNLFPQEWRIRSTHLPEAFQSLVAAPPPPPSEVE